MSLNGTPAADRVHIGFFGIRNAGKSSLVNALTGQEMSLVSPVAGTTTDPVRKTMELLPIGPVVVLDTPGLDDEGELGEKRVQRTEEMLNQTDLAVLVRTDPKDYLPSEKAWIKRIAERGIPCLEVISKADQLPVIPAAADRMIPVSALTGYGIQTLKEALGRLAHTEIKEKQIVTDLLAPGDSVVLVMPIDASAPKGRLILPQVQTLRELLDGHYTATVCQPEEIPRVLENSVSRPAMVITDSQAFDTVSRNVPDSIPLTSFSILFARYRGNLEKLTVNANRLAELRDGDRILISEGCTHHRQCQDIGTVKIPQWIERFSGRKPEYAFSSGGSFPEDLSGFRLIVHCGGCMINEREMQSRMLRAEAQGVPMVNYGIAIAFMHGILRRSLSPFPDIQRLLRTDDNS